MDTQGDGIAVPRHFLDLKDFDSHTLRAMLSFEMAMRQLGGDVVNLSAAELQLSRGETAADTARVLSRYVDAIMLRTDNAARLKEMADYATVPVINGLTNMSHPCQLMADIMTFEEHRGPIANQVVAWVITQQQRKGGNTKWPSIKGAARTRPSYGSRG